MVPFLRYFAYLRYSPISILSLMVISFVVSGAIVFVPGLQKLLFDKLFITFDRRLLVVFVILSIFIIIYEIIFTLLFQVILKNIRQNVANKAKVDLLNRVFGSTYHFLKKHDTGFIVKRVVDDSELVADGVTELYKVFCSFAQLVVIALIMYHIDHGLLKLYLMAVLAAPVWFIIWSYPATKAANKVGLEQSNLFAYFWELFPGIVTVKVNNLYEIFFERLETIHKKLSKELYFNTFYLSTLWKLPELLPLILYGAIIYYGLEKLQSGEFTTGVFLGLLSMLWLIFNPLVEISKSVLSITNAIAAAGRMATIEKAPQEEDGTVVHRRLEKSVVFQDVSFSWDKKGSGLQKVSLAVPKGGNIGLVGETGSGKSTIINLLLRLLIPQKGEITVDGTSLQEYTLASLRKNMVFIQQDPHLFHGTIRENIDILGTRSDSELYALLHKINLYDKISQLKNGLDTNINDEGVGFSGGEKQRLCILRAVTGNEEIVIFDEITAALDPENEEKILDNIYSLVADKTVITISHKLKNISYCNYIYLLGNGTILEEGSYSDLVKRDAHFTTLFGISKREKEV